MAVIIQEVLPRSLAARQGIRAGETLVTINGNVIRDFIDLQYYGSEQYLSLQIIGADKQERYVEIIRRDATALGIEPEPYKHACCRNHCIFCFIDQMPPALRNTLYVKDDDYLYSFVFGNYITLTNLSEDDFQRIISQKLSPVYVSVHTTDPHLRRRMMGYEQEFDVLQRLQQLGSHGIRIHTQIVLVPGWNDEDNLLRTLTDLSDPSLCISSVGIVPVGLTRWRQKLTPLQPFTPEGAAQVIRSVDTWRAEHQQEYVYCADEFYTHAGIDIPPREYYADYPQIENGIGMLSLLMDNWKARKRSFIKDLRKKNKPLLMVCGVSASSYLEQIAHEITAKAECCPARVQPVINHFMGENVTVSGLLTFTDLQSQVKPQGEEIIALSSSIFNHDGVTLDGFSQLDIKEHWGRDLLIVDPLLEDWEWL